MSDRAREDFSNDRLGLAWSETLVVTVSSSAFGRRMTVAELSGL
jgi:hypothetical protein